MTATTKTHIIDALDEFYGVRCQDKIRGVGGGGLIEEEEDMNEFDEDVVCLFDEDKNDEDLRREEITVSGTKTMEGRTGALKRRKEQQQQRRRQRRRRITTTFCSMAFTTESPP